MTENIDSLEGFEKELSEKHLEEQVQKAEVGDVQLHPSDDEDGLIVTFTTVSGHEESEYLPMPDVYHPAHSDLVCLVEFVGGNPGDLNSLEGQRVPFRNGNVLWANMREVLELEQSAANEWDHQKRMEKVADRLNARW